MAGVALLRPTRKVTWATIGTYLGTVVALGAVQALQGHLDVLTALLPPWANVVIAPLLPALLTFITGWLTTHAPNDVLLPTTNPASRAGAPL